MLAKTLERAASTCGVDFLGGFFALVQKGFSAVGLDMINVPGDTTAEVISAIIADEATIGMVNSRTTAVRIIPAIGKGVGEELNFGGLLGEGPVMPLNTASPAVFMNRGGRIPAPCRA